MNWILLLICVIGAMVSGDVNFLIAAGLFGIGGEIGIHNDIIRGREDKKND